MSEPGSARVDDRTPSTASDIWSAIAVYRCKVSCGTLLACPELISLPDGRGICGLRVFWEGRAICDATDIEDAVHRLQTGRTGDAAWDAQASGISLPPSCDWRRSAP